MIYLAERGRLAACVQQRLEQARGSACLRQASGDVAPRPDDAIVVALDGCAVSALDYWATIAQRWRIPLWCAYVDNGEATIGLTIDPGRPGCLRCWRRHAFAGRAEAMAYGDAASWHDGTPIADPWLTSSAIASIAVIATERIIDRIGAHREPSMMPAPVYCWNLRALTGGEQRYLPDEQCPRCGDLIARPRGLTRHLTDRPKPTAAADRLGDVGHLAAVIGRAAGPVDMVTKTNIAEHFANGAVAITDVWLWAESQPEPCSGFNASYDAARTTSYLEALERYAGAHPIDRGRRVQGTVEGFGDIAVPPTRFGLYSEEQYAKRPDALIRYRDDLELPFIWAHALAHEQEQEQAQAGPRLIPRALAFYSAPRPGAPVVAIEGSNGCALGSCAEEAIFHGLGEVLERDAFLMAWLTRRAGPLLDVMACGDTEVRTRCRALRAAGYDVFAIDITTDLRIPALWLMARRRDGQAPRTVSTAACHIRPERALLKAIRELSAMVDRYIAELADPVSHARAWWLAEDLSRVQTMNDHSLGYCVPETANRFEFLLASPERTTCDRMSAYARDLWADDLTVELRGMIGRVTEAGGELFAVDQTRPEQRALGFCTYKALVAGTIPIAWGADLQRLEGLPRLRAALAAPPTAAVASYANPDPHPFT